jgi:hypothetical protein
VQIASVLNAVRGRLGWVTGTAVATSLVLLVPAVPASAVSLPSPAYVDPGWTVSSADCPAGSSLDLPLPAAGQAGDIRIAVLSAGVWGFDPRVPIDTLGTVYAQRAQISNNQTTTATGRFTTGHERTIAIFTSETGAQTATTLSFPCPGVGIPVTLSVVIGRPAPGHRAVYDAYNGNASYRVSTDRAGAIVNYSRELVLAGVMAVGSPSPITADPLSVDLVEWDRDIVSTSADASTTIFANGHGTTWSAGGAAGITLRAPARIDWAVATVTIHQI